MSLHESDAETKGHGRVTLQIIAERLEVSTATVSLALRDSTVVADATKRKVQRVAREMGYIVNRSAASLRTARTNILAVAFHDVANPFFSEMLAAIDGKAALAETARCLRIGAAIAAGAGALGDGGGDGIAGKDARRGRHRRSAADRAGINRRPRSRIREERRLGCGLPKLPTHAIGQPHRKTSRAFDRACQEQLPLALRPGTGWNPGARIFATTAPNASPPAGPSSTA